MSAASSTPPQLPLGDETSRNDEELPLGDETLGTKGRDSPTGERGVIDAATASLEGQNPGNNNNYNAQPSRVGSNGDNNPNNKNTNNNDTTKMMHNHQG